MESILTVGQGSFLLHRVPKRPRELLRAWDAADEYILDYLAYELMPATDVRLLIMNDNFGALAVALHGLSPQTVSDSYLSQQATRLNLIANDLPEPYVTFSTSLDALDGYFDLVLIKVPKTLALLEDELIRLRPHLTPSSVIVVAGMVKTLPSSVWALLERLVGETTTALAKKKARLIFVTFNPNLPTPCSPYPVEYRLENTDYVLINHANVFSRDSLDIGTRFFLKHIPVRAEARDIIDLGCGNGVVGLLAAQLNPAARLYFVDESFMAVASAKENFYRAFGQARAANFVVGDGLVDSAEQSADLILCNPPFHQQNTVGDQLAVNMFRQSYKVLRQSGELWVIGNRHLAYQFDLKRLFGNCVTVASNAKFVILMAQKLIAVNSGKKNPGF